LARGRAVRHVASGVGFKNELADMERLWHDESTVAVLTDLTTCVRHADLRCIESWTPRPGVCTNPRPATVAAVGDRGRRHASIGSRRGTLVLSDELNLRQSTNPARD